MLGGLVKTNGWASMAILSMLAASAPAKLLGSAWATRHGDHRDTALLQGDLLTMVTQKPTCARIAYNLANDDAQVATKLVTFEQGELDFQVYFVRERWQPTVRPFASTASKGGGQPGSTARHRGGGCDSFGPSNPWLARHLAVPGLRDRSLARDAPVWRFRPSLAAKRSKVQRRS